MRKAAMITPEQEILQCLKDVVGTPNPSVALHEPVFQGQEWSYVKNCLDSGWVSSVGQYVPLFEEKIAQACGTGHAVATINGTAALHLALKVVGVQPGDEVLVPSMTFIATANAVSYCSATPHFVDSARTTLGLDAEKLGLYLERIARPSAGGVLNVQTGRRIAAIIPVHVFGHPVDMDPLLALASHYEIPVIEDAAESLGSLYKNRKTGSFGRLAALSFNGNKIVTTGGGGAIVTNDADLAARVRHLATTAKQPHAWAFDHDEIGYNYRLPNLNAALGCGQIDRLYDFVKSKRALANTYEKACADIRSAYFFREPDFVTSNYWLNTLLLDDETAPRRNDILKTLHEAGYLCRPVWTLMHRLPMYGSCPHMDLSTAEDLAQRIVNLPSGARLGERYAT